MMDCCMLRLWFHPWRPEGFHLISVRTFVRFWTHKWCPIGHNLSVRARDVGHQLLVITGKMTLTEIFRVQSIYAALLYNKAKPVFSSSTGTLQWRHNECDSVSNHLHIDCLLNCLFRHRKHQSSISLAFVRGIHRWPVNSLHKGTVTENASIWWHHHGAIQRWSQCTKDDGLSKALISCFKGQEFWDDLCGNIELCYWLDNN